VSQAERWQHGVNIKNFETRVNDAVGSLESYFIRNWWQFFCVCVCSSVSYSSLGSAKYQTALIFCSQAGAFCRGVVLAQWFVGNRCLPANGTRGQFVH